MSDIANALHFVWPAQYQGRLVPPPPYHVLDRLIRCELAGESPEVDAELMFHPDAGTVAIISDPPTCDICARDGVKSPARYDAPTRPEVGFRGLWGNMCPDHYQRCSTGRLGIGEGQFLMRHTEVPKEVWEALEVARAYWSRWAKIDGAEAGEK